jgi:hypothetical protein
VQLSGGTRLVIDGARNLGLINVAGDPAGNVLGVVAGIRSGKRYPPLIAVEGSGGFLVLMEGHTRATAYCLAKFKEPIDALVGSSPALKQWSYY